MSDKPENLTAWTIGYVGTDYNFWQGVGELEFEGKTYMGAGSVIEISPFQSDLQHAPRRMTVRVALAKDASIRAAFMQDDGPVPIRVEWLFSKDNGLSWKKMPLRFVGRLSNPTMQNQVLTVEIETFSGDVDRGVTRIWSDATHQAAYPGDRFFEDATALIAGEATERWPT